LGAWSSGTGAAGIVGAGLWWLLRGLGVKAGLGISSVSCWFPAIHHRHWHTKSYRNVKADQPGLTAAPTRYLFPHPTAVLILQVGPRLPRYPLSRWRGRCSSASRRGSQHTNRRRIRKEQCDPYHKRQDQSGQTSTCPIHAPPVHGVRRGVCDQLGKSVSSSLKQELTTYHRELRRRLSFPYLPPVYGPSSSNHHETTTLSGHSHVRPLHPIAHNPRPN
jgi:hypothetical protein